MTTAEFNLQRSGPFQNVADLMGQFFALVNSEELAKSTCLLITKQRSIKAEGVKATLEEMTEEYDFTKPAEAFIKELSKYSHVVFFPEPNTMHAQTGGRFLDLKDLLGKSVRDSILLGLKKTSYMENIVPTLIVSDRTKNFAVAIAKRFGTEVEEIIKTSIAQGIYDHCHGKISTGTNPADLRTYFTDLALRLAEKENKNTLGLDYSTLDSFESGMQGILKHCEKIDLYDQIRTHIRYITFLKTIVPDVEYPLKDWVTALTLPKTFIALLGENPKAHYNKNTETLQLSGFLLGISDIQSGLQGSKPKIITLYGFNRLWLDEDIISVGTVKKNGRSFGFIAPNWITTGARLIDLHGENGANGSSGVHGTKSGDSGTDGNPGQHGGHGGSLYGKGKHFEGMSHLTFKVDAGDGGQGGNGGNGVKGADGTHGDTTKVTRTEQYWAFASNKENSFFNDCLGGDAQHEVTMNGWKYFYEDQGTNGKSGGNGGKGGESGKGGSKGSIVIDGFTLSHNSKDGKAPAKDGTHGTSGTGGAHGQHCQGEVFDVIATWQDWAYEGDERNKSRAIKRTLTDIQHKGGRGSASSGTKPTTLNTDGQTAQVIQLSLTKDPLVQAYEDLYKQLDPLNPFIGKWE